MFRFRLVYSIQAIRTESHTPHSTQSIFFSSIQILDLLSLFLSFCSLCVVRAVAYVICLPQKIEHFGMNTKTCEC